MTVAVPPGTRALVTGGAGFIGSSLVQALLALGCRVTNLDKLTYAALPGSLGMAEGDPAYRQVTGDVADPACCRAALEQARPQVIFHLAAESHVDRSIDQPAAFVRTNVLGTSVLLDAALAYWQGLPAPEQAAFRFLHVSTDEVFGSLGPEGAFTESSPYRPRSPYSASKAGADHLARVWGMTYGLPLIVTHGSNTYGPRQHPEKLIPKTIVHALTQRPIPIYADGSNVRDWLHVDDHVDGLLRAWRLGTPQHSYALGGGAELDNLTLVRRICALLDRDAPAPGGESHARLITFVADRPMHDFRYAIDARRAQQALGWTPHLRLEEGLAATVRWYLDNRDWWAPAVA